MDVNEYIILSESGERALALNDEGSEMKMKGLCCVLLCEFELNSYKYILQQMKSKQSYPIHSTTIIRLCWLIRIRHVVQDDLLLILIRYCYYANKNAATDNTLLLVLVITQLLF